MTDGQIEELWLIAKGSGPTKERFFERAYELLASRVLAENDKQKAAPHAFDLLKTALRDDHGCYSV